MIASLFAVDVHIFVVEIDPSPDHSRILFMSLDILLLLWHHSMGEASKLIF